MPMKDLTRILQRKSPLLSCWHQLSLSSINSQHIGQQHVQDYFITSYIPKRTLGSNLEGFLWTLRTHNMYLHLWSKLCLPKVHQEQEKNWCTSAFHPKSVLAVPLTLWALQGWDSREKWDEGDLHVHQGATGAVRAAGVIPQDWAQPSPLSSPLHFALIAWSTFLKAEFIAGLQTFIRQLLDWCQVMVISCSREGFGDCFEEGPAENSPFMGVKDNTVWGDGGKDIKPLFQADPAKYSISSNGRAIAFENVKVKF